MLASIRHRFGPVNLGFSMPQGSSFAYGTGRQAEEKRADSRVLIALPEKDSRLLEMLKGHFEGKGYRVATAVSGREMLDTVKSHALDAIIASTEIESLDEVRRIFSEIWEIDHIIETLFLGLGIPDHQNFTSNAQNSIGMVYLTQVRDRVRGGDAGREMLETLEARVQKRINDERDGIKRQRELFYGTLNRYVEEMHSSYDPSKSADSLRATPELGQWMQYRYHRFPDPEGGFIEFRLDSIKGTVSASFSGIDGRRHYGRNEVAYNIKHFDSMGQVAQYMEDYKTKGEGAKPFPLARLVKFADEEQGILALLEMQIGPTTATAMENLKKTGGRYAMDAIDALVRISLKKSAEWWKRTKAEVDDSEEALRDAKELYSTRVHDALTFSAQHYDAGLDSELAETAKAEFDGLLKGMHRELFGRIFDNSPHNSGLELRILNPTGEEILNLLQAASKKPRDAVEKLFRMRDQYMDRSEKGINPRHALEDFFHMADSYEAGLSEDKKMEFYIKFMRTLLPEKFRFGASRSLNELLHDFFALGFYRNIRKAHLVASEYAVKNEMEWRTFHNNDRSLYESEREEYAKKLIHYAGQAAKYAAVRIAFLDRHPGFMRNSPNENVRIISNLLQEYEQGTLDLAKAENNPLYVSSRKVAGAYFRPDQYVLSKTTGEYTGGM